MAFPNELYKFQSNVLANNSATEYRTDLRLGEVVYLLIFYILWRDSQNRE